MAKINKIDYYCGAFLSYLVSNGANEPVMFDSGDSNSKGISFAVKYKNYNAYVKYVGKAKHSKNKNIEYSRWNATFTLKEAEQLIKGDFLKANHENLVVIVCSNEDLKNTCIAVLTYAEAIKCLGHDSVNEQRRISIKHKKGSKYLTCYGTGVSDNNAILLNYNFGEYFDFECKRLKRRCLEEHRPEPIQLNEIAICSTVNV